MSRIYLLPKTDHVDWVRRYTPSAVSDQCTWLQAFSPSYRAEPAARKKLLYERMDAWRGKTQEELEEEGKRLLDGVVALAKEVNWRVGKWMMRWTLEEAHCVDEVWGKLVALCVADALGPCSVKCATKALAESRTDRPHYTICVYVPDGLDKEAVFRVRELLRDQLGIRDTLQFKLDIMTALQFQGPTWLWEG